MGAWQVCDAGGRVPLTTNRAIHVDRMSDFNLPVKNGIWNSHDVVKDVEFGVRKTHR